MMKLFYISWILILVYSCKQSQSGCEKFKTGRFVSHSADDQYTVIERSDTIQVETNKLTGHVFKSKIKWTSDCENELSDIEEAEDSSDSLKPIWIGKIVTTKILKVEKDYCVYESSMTGVSMRMIDTLYVLK